MMQNVVTGTPAAPMPSRVSAWAIYDVFSCAGEEQIFLGVVSDSQWKSFCEVFGFDAFGSDPQLASNNQRVAARQLILPLVRDCLAGMSKVEVMALCEKAGLPFSPIQRPQDMFEDKHLNESGGMAQVTLPDGQSVKVPMLPFEMDGQRFATRLNVPGLGSHSDELLAELGYTAADICALHGAGVIKSEA
jgi:crotonobetainyl-CoA:carnitine CoA-transferase CaiB-like acyl-CoA transferase